MKEQPGEFSDSVDDSGIIAVSMSRTRLFSRILTVGARYNVPLNNVKIPEGEYDDGDVSQEI